jgi:hypothetical protein
MFTNVKFTCSKLLSYIIVFIGAIYAFGFKKFDDGLWLIAMGAGLQGGKTFLGTKERMNKETLCKEVVPDGIERING